MKGPKKLGLTKTELPKWGFGAPGNVLFSKGGEVDESVMPMEEVTHQRQEY